MRWGHAIRTLAVFVLLGMVATVLSSWAIHAGYSWQDHQQSNAYRGWQTGPERWLTEHTTSSRASTREIDMDAHPWHAHRILPAHHLDDAPVRAIVMGYAGFDATGWRARELGVLTIRNDAPVPWHSVSGASLASESLAWFRSGWPAKAMGHGTYMGIFGRDDASPVLMKTTSVSLSGGIDLSSTPLAPHTRFGKVNGFPSPLDRFALPLRPLWPGFAINTSFYALLLFIAWRTPSVVRRTLRRRCGRCARCGYDRGGLDADAACPECGAVARQPARRSAVVG